MMSEAQHLTDDEVERLVQAELAVDNDQNLRLGEDRQAHANDCVSCRERITQAKNLLSQLKQLRGASGVGTKDCFSQSDWFELVAGVRPQKQQQEALLHASTCDHCGALLRSATEMLDSESNSEAATLAAQSQSNGQRWQHTLAVQLAENQRKSLDRGNRAFRILVWAAVSVAAVVAVALLLRTQRRGPDEAADLIARGYEARRLFESRVPGAEPVPLASVSRGRVTDIPPSLHEALAIIDKHLEEDPKSPVWLELKGRAAFVTGDLEGAIESFSRALDFAGNDKSMEATLESDLATALSARAATEGEGPQRGQDLKEAKQRILQAASSRSDDPVIEFNKALIERQIGEWNNAVNTLQAFLQRYPKDPWAGEARGILAELQAKISIHKQSLPKSPDYYLRNVSRFPAEAYLGAAISDWIPLRGVPSSREALERLGAEFESKHHDRWLIELLRQNQGENALNLIATAVGANERGDYSGAIQSSIAARRALVPEEAPAGYAMALLQEVYARQLLYQGHTCVQEGSRLAQFLKAHPEYQWLKIQAQLELAVCNNFIGQLWEAKQNIHSALEAADKSGFHIIRLRVLGLWATLERQQGNAAMTWDLSARGLATYWASWAPPIRAHQFFTEMAAAAEADNQWKVAVTLQQEGVRAIENDEDLDYIAVTRFRLARMAEAAGYTGLAANEFREAELLFQRAPDQPSAKIHRLESLVGLAAIQLKLGRLDECRSQIDAIRPLLSVADPYYVTLRFYETLGDLEVRGGSAQPAAAAYRSGINVAEAALSATTTRADRLRWMAETDHSYRALSGLLARGGQAAAAWQLWERHTQSFAMANRIAPESQGRTVHSSESKDQVFRNAHLTILDTQVGLAEWLVKGQQVHLEWLSVSPEQFRASATRLTQLCSDPTSDERAITRESRQLYDWVLAPLKSQLADVAELTVQPDFLTPDFPFEVLQDEQGRAVIEHLRISYSPTLNYAATNSGDAPVPQTSKVVFLLGSEVAPSSAGMTVPLEGMKREVAFLQSRFANVDVLDARTASNREVIDHLREGSIVHFSGHGVSWLTGSGLLLSSPSNGDPVVITPESIDSIPESANRLVFLAACSTARGTNRSLLDPNSLVLSFLRSGARSVIASRWAVDSRATTDLSIDFYDEITKGKSSEEALFIAMDRIKREFGHPFYWSGFSIFTSAQTRRA